MKTITNEVKSKIFAQYFGAEYNYKNEFGTYKGVVEFGYNTSKDISQDAVLRLTSLSKITDKDAVEAIQMTVPVQYDEIKIESKDSDGVYFSFQPRRGGRISGCLTYNDLVFDVYQLLQSKGYALNYLQYTVQDLVDAGIYKLK